MTSSDAWSQFERVQLAIALVISNVINVIGNTTNRGRLVVRARLDRRHYPTGKKISRKELRQLRIERHDFPR